MTVFVEVVLVQARTGGRYASHAVAMAHVESAVVWGIWINEST